MTTADQVNPTGTEVPPNLAKLSPRAQEFITRFSSTKGAKLGLGGLSRPSSITVNGPSGPDKERFVGWLKRAVPVLAISGSMLAAAGMYALTYGSTHGKKSGVSGTNPIELRSERLQERMPGTMEMMREAARLARVNPEPYAVLIRSDSALEGLSPTEVLAGFAQSVNAVNSQTRSLKQIDSAVREIVADAWKNDSSPLMGLAAYMQSPDNWKATVGQMRMQGPQAVLDAADVLSYGWAYARSVHQLLATQLSATTPRNVQARKIGANFADIARSAIGLAQSVASATVNRDMNSTARDLSGLARDGVSMYQQGQAVGSASGTRRVDQVSRMVDSAGRLYQNSQRATRDYDKRALDKATQELRQSGYGDGGTALQYREREGG